MAVRVVKEMSYQKGNPLQRLLAALVNCRENCTTLDMTCSSSKSDADCNVTPLSQAVLFALANQLIKSRKEPRKKARGLAHNQLHIHEADYSFPVDLIFFPCNFT